MHMHKSDKMGRAIAIVGGLLTILILMVHDCATADAQSKPIATVPVSLTTQVTGTLPPFNGGTGQDFSSATGVVKFASGTAATVAPGATGNVLSSNGSDWVSQAPAGAGWSTIFDCDFTAQTTQSLATDGNYTICGISWQKENSANDRVAMAVTSGTGLVIQPNNSVYNGTTRSAPLVWATLSAMGVTTSLDWSSQVRVWLYEGTESQTIDNGDGTVVGLDNNGVGWSSGWGQFGTNGFNARVMKNGIINNGGGFVSSGASPGTFSGNPVTLFLVTNHTMQSTQLVSDSFFSKTATAWPLESSLSPVSGVQTASSVNLTNVTPPLNTSTGVVLAAFAGSNSDHYLTTIKRIRLDTYP